MNYKIINKQDYLKKYQINDVKPFTYEKSINGHTNLIDFGNLVRKNEIGKIAYWFIQKNNKNKDFQYCHDGLTSSDYEYCEFFSNAIEIATNEKNTDFIEFLLFDDNNKYSKLLTNYDWLEHNEIQYDLDDDPDYFMFLSKHGIIGGTCYFNHKVFTKNNSAVNFLTELVTYFASENKKTFIKYLKVTLENSYLSPDVDADLLMSTIQLIERKANLNSKLVKKLINNSNSNNNVNKNKI